MCRVDEVMNIDRPLQLLCSSFPSCESQQQKVAMMDAAGDVMETPVREQHARCLVDTPVKVPKSKPVTTNAFNGALEKVSEKSSETCCETEKNAIKTKTKTSKPNRSKLTNLAKEQLVPIKPARSIFKHYDLTSRELMHGWWWYERVLNMNMSKVN